MGFCVGETIRLPQRGFTLKKTGKEGLTNPRMTAILRFVCFGLLQNYNPTSLIGLGSNC